MQRNLRFERHYAHPPERVWHALTDSEALAAWFAENDFKPEVGHTFQFQTDTGPGYDGILHCEVIAVDAPHHLAYTFKGGYMRSTTTVRWTLTPSDGGTKLVLEHTGFAGVVDTFVSFIIGSGWGKYLNALPDVLAQLSQHEHQNQP